MSVELSFIKWADLFVCKIKGGTSYGFNYWRRPCFNGSRSWLEQACRSFAEDESGQRVTISADQVLTEGVEIGGISIGANRVAFYAPGNDVGDKVTVTPIVESGTRIANINENMWSELFLMNKQPLLDQMDSFITEMQTLRKMLANDDKAGLCEKMKLSTKRRALFNKK